MTLCQCWLAIKSEERRGGEITGESKKVIRQNGTSLEINKLGDEEESGKLCLQRERIPLEQRSLLITLQTFHPIN